MDVLRSLFFIVLIKICTGSPAYKRSLTKDLVSCPADSNNPEYLQERDACYFRCLTDEHCRSSQTRCCSTGCGTLCVQVSLLDVGAQEDDDEIPQVRESPEATETDSLINRQLEKLREKLNEKRLSPNSSSSSSEGEGDENESEENGESSSSSAESDDVGSDVDSSSYDVTTGFTTVGSSAAPDVTTESFGDMFDDYSIYGYDEEDDDDDLEMLLLKLLYKIKSEKNAENNLSGDSGEDVGLLPEDQPFDDTSGSNSVDGPTDAEEFANGVTRRRSSMERREEKLDDVSGKLKTVGHNNAMR